jgi:hypothetical protein
VYQSDIAAQWFSHFLLKAFVRRVCDDIKELKAKMEELYGKNPGFQYGFKLLPGVELKP